MATLTGILTGQGSGSVSVPAHRRRRPVVATESRDVGVPLDLPANLTPAQHHRRLINAYGAVPQYKGARAPKLTDAQKGIIAEVYSRFSDPLAAWARRQYRQHSLHIPNIAKASPGQVARARSHHALGGGLPRAPAGVDTGVPPADLAAGTDTRDVGVPAESSLASAMTHGPPAPPPTPALPTGVSARELGYLSKALTPGQRRRVGLF